MALPRDLDTDRLLERAGGGDRSAVEQLLGKCRSRLRQMVAVRMDDRLSARVDPSDVVQETLLVASERLPAYLAHPALPFYLWLRRIAWERLVDLHRRHIRADRRSVLREEPLRVSDTSAMQLADRLFAGGTGPLKRLLRAELVARVRTAVGRLAEGDREILLLRHLEQLKLVDCALVLEISQTAAKKRYLRALERLHRLLRQQQSGNTP